MGAVGSESDCRSRARKFDPSIPKTYPNKRPHCVPAHLGLNCYISLFGSLGLKYIKLFHAVSLLPL